MIHELLQVHSSSSSSSVRVALKSVVFNDETIAPGTQFENVESPWSNWLYGKQRSQWPNCLLGPAVYTMKLDHGKEALFMVRFLEKD